MENCVLVGNIMSRLRNKHLQIYNIIWDIYLDVVVLIDQMFNLYTMDINVDIGNKYVKYRVNIEKNNNILAIFHNIMVVLVGNFYF